MLLVATAVKLVAEIALMALLGRWLLGLMAGAGRASNPFYRLLDAMVKPFVAAARRLAPRAVIERHLPLAAGAMLLLVWLIATFAKIAVCLQIGLQSCR